MTTDRAARLIDAGLLAPDGAEHSRPVSSRGSLTMFEETLMHADDIKARLHGVLHRHPKATEDEVEAVAAVVLAIVGEVTAELAIVIGELAARVDALERNV